MCVWERNRQDEGWGSGEWGGETSGREVQALCAVSIRGRMENKRRDAPVSFLCLFHQAFSHTAVLRVMRE